MKPSKHDMEFIKRGLFLIRGDNFDFSFAFWAEHKKAIINEFNEKRFTNKSIGKASYRIVNHWTKLGLINDNRENNQQWRKFSLLDLIWLNIIKQLRIFGFPNEKILKTKKCLFPSQVKNNKLLSFFEYYVAEAFFKKTPVDLLIFSDGLCDLASQFELESSKRLSLPKEDYISISLNKILQGLFIKKDLKANYYFGIPLKQEELELIGILQNKNYKQITITRKNGKIEKIDATEGVKAKRIVDLIKEHKYQKIVAHVENGKVVSTERTVKSKT